MKRLHSILLFILGFYPGIESNAQKNAGIFYSTLYAKEGIYNRQDYFGDKADCLFLKDVNGDGMENKFDIDSNNNGINDFEEFKMAKDPF